MKNKKEHPRIAKVQQEVQNSVRLGPPVVVTRIHTTTCSATQQVADSPLTVRLGKRKSYHTVTRCLN